MDAPLSNPTGDDVARVPHGKNPTARSDERRPAPDAPVLRLDASQGASARARRSRRSRAEIVALRRQQAATAEVLRVVSSSPAEVQPMFGAIASSATRLCDASFCIVFRFDGEMITVAADDGRSPGSAGRHSGRVWRQSRPFRWTSTEHAPSLGRSERADNLRKGRARPGDRLPGVLAVPMMRARRRSAPSTPLRLEAIPFTDTQVETPQDLRRSGRDRDRERAAC